MINAAVKAVIASLREAGAAIHTSIHAPHIDLCSGAFLDRRVASLLAMTA
jgi:hypothetical protein